MKNKFEICCLIKLYATTTATWSSLPPLLGDDVEGLSAAVVGDDIYVMHRFDPDPFDSTVLPPRAQRYRSVAGYWEDLGRLPFTENPGRLYAMCLLL